MPDQFSPAWDNLELKLPANLRTTALRADFVEVLKKIRSIECQRCERDRDSGKPSLCAQEPGGNGTWKCNRCYTKHYSHCDWMSKCSQFGLGFTPPINRKHASSARLSQSRSITHSTPEVLSSALSISSSGPRTRASTRTQSFTPPAPSPGPSSSNASSSRTVDSSRAAVSPPDWMTPLQELANAVEHNHQQTNEMITAMARSLEQLKAQLLQGGDAVPEGKGKERAS
ncbi:hypothetical protein C8Q76DRAFT_792192 [Earliella scabrosa]|nr:hypothetical protein C8Q76DRAFT_792192 [Earliella scabrosa]